MFKKIRFTTEYIVSYFKKNIVYVFLGLIIGSLIFIEKTNIFVLVQKLQTTEKTIGVEGLYPSDNLPPEIAKLVSFGLTQTSENDRIINSPIFKKLDIRNNNQEYRFTIDNDLTWQNGKKLVSSDIVYPNLNLNLSYPDNSTVVVTLNTSFSPILSILTQPIFLKNSRIGLGNFRIISATFSEGYYKTIQLQNQVTGEDIVYKFYSSEKDLINAFKLGEVGEISLSQIPQEFNQWPGINISKTISIDRYSAIFLNTEKLGQKSIRQALAYATPKTKEKNQRCLGPVSPNSWAYNPSVKEYNFDSARSKELFNNDQLPTIKLLVADRKLLSTAEIIKEAWQKVLGIDVQLSASVQGASINDFDAILAYGQIPIDPDQFTYWHSTQSQTTNITHLNNPRIDKLLEEGRTISDVIERKRIYQDFQRYLLEESPAIFLEFPTTYTIYRVK